MFYLLVITIAISFMTSISNNRSCIMAFLQNSRRVSTPGNCNHPDHFHTVSKPEGCFSIPAQPGAYKILDFISLGLQLHESFQSENTWELCSQKITKTNLQVTGLYLFRYLFWKILAELLSSSGIEMQCSQDTVYHCMPQPTIYFNCQDHFSLVFNASPVLCALLLHSVSQRWLLLPFCLRNAGSLTSELFHLNF